MLHSIVANLLLTVPSLSTTQISKDPGFDKEHLSVMVFLNNLSVT